jgi:hypothetical protein
MPDDREPITARPSRPASKETVRMPADQARSALADAAPTTPTRHAGSLPPAAADRISIVSEHLPELVRLVVEADGRSKAQHGEILEALARARLERAEARQETTEILTNVKELNKVALTHTASFQMVDEALKRIRHRQEHDHQEVCLRLGQIEHQIGIAARDSQVKAERDAEQSTALQKLEAEASQQTAALSEVKAKAMVLAESDEEQKKAIARHERMLTIKRVVTSGVGAGGAYGLIQAIEWLLHKLIGG